MEGFKMGHTGKEKMSTGGIPLADQQKRCFRKKKWQKRKGRPGGGKKGEKPCIRKGIQEGPGITNKLILRERSRGKIDFVRLLGKSQGEKKKANKERSHDRHRYLKKP